ncbi:hypothetical protein ABIA28_001085 [Bradyrhizobium elkanii]
MTTRPCEAPAPEPPEKRLQQACGAALGRGREGVVADFDGPAALADRDTGQGRLVLGVEPTLRAGALGAEQQQCARAQAEQPAERGQNGNDGGHLTYLTVLLSALYPLSISAFNSAGQQGASCMEPRLAAEYALYMVAISAVKWLEDLMNRQFRRPACGDIILTLGYSPPIHPRFLENGREFKTPARAV